MDLLNRYKLLKFYDKDPVAVSVFDGGPVTSLEVKYVYLVGLDSN
jgi:hypothetical protein